MDAIECQWRCTFYYLISIFPTQSGRCQWWAWGKVPSRYEGDGKQILEEVKSQHDGLLLMVLTSTNMTDWSKFEKNIDVGMRMTISVHQHVLCNNYFVLTVNTMIRDSLYTKYIHKSVTILSQNVLSLNYRCIVHVYLNIRVFLLKSCKPIFSKTWRDRRKPKTSLHAACQIL